MKYLLLRPRVVVRTSHMKISRRRLVADCEKIAPKSVPHDYFFSFNQSYHCFVSLQLLVRQLSIEFW